MIVAHRDQRGEIEAVSLVARPSTRYRRSVRAIRRRSTRRFDALVEHVTDIIACSTPEGVVEYASPATARILGYDDGALEGHRPAHLGSPRRRTRRALLAGQPDEQGIGEPVELRLSAADASWRHLEVVVSDLTDNPAIGGLVLNGRDVTERVETAQALAAKAYTDAFTELPSRMRMLDRLATWLRRSTMADGLSAAASTSISSRASTRRSAARSATRC